MPKRRHAAGPDREGPGRLASRAGREAGETDALIARLADLPTRDLRAQWVRLYHAEPTPRLSRDLLVRGIAWKIQEQAHGGLSATTKRRLRLLADRLASGADFGTPERKVVRPGARLIREWRAQVHTVTVVEGGFEYIGRRWRSLSEIAQAITGTHWSGPRFFGLTRDRKPSSGSMP